MTSAHSAEGTGGGGGGDDDIDLCSPDPCNGHGVCEEVGTLNDQWRCTCHPEYEGSVCDREYVNECDPDPCADQPGTFCVEYTEPGQTFCIPGEATVREINPFEHYRLRLRRRRAISDYHRAPAPNLVGCARLCQLDVVCVGFNAPTDAATPPIECQLLYAYQPGYTEPDDQWRVYSLEESWQ